MVEAVLLGPDPQFARLHPAVLREDDHSDAWGHAPIVPLLADPLIDQCREVSDTNTRPMKTGSSRVANRFGERGPGQFRVRAQLPDRVRWSA